MNHGDILAALKTRWDAASVSDTVTGGLHGWGDVAKNTSMPYVDARVLPGGPDIFANTGDEVEEFYEKEVELTLYSTSGTAAMSANLDAVKNAFDQHVLSISGATFQHCRVSDEDGPEPSARHPNAREWRLRFVLRFSEQRDLTPA